MFWLQASPPPRAASIPPMVSAAQGASLPPSPLPPNPGRGGGHTGPRRHPERASCLRGAALAGAHLGSWFYRPARSPAATLGGEGAARLQRPVRGAPPSGGGSFQQRMSAPRTCSVEASGPRLECVCTRAHAAHSRSSPSQTHSLSGHPNPGAPAVTAATKPE